MKPYQTSTEEFVAGFRKASDYRGDIAMMVSKGIMPRMVNRDDPRVKTIIAKCRKNTTAKTTK